MSRRTWLRNWLKPANLIALGILIVTGIGVFQATKNSINISQKNKQVVTADNQGYFILKRAIIC